MKNITINLDLNIDEKVLAAVRRHAALHNSMVNRLIRDYSNNLAAHQDRASRGRNPKDASAGKTWSRAGLYDR